jgi:opacity protein-like surface antigen
MVRLCALEGTSMSACSGVRKIGAFVLLALTACVAGRAQDIGSYSNRKVYSGFVEYSNDSSHMLLGYAEGRKITAFGASFQRRMFLRDGVTGSWLAEVRPYMRETDPTMKGFSLFFPQQPAYSGVVNFASPVPVDQPVSSKPQSVVLVTQNQVYPGTATYIGGTRTTYVAAFSPIGYKVSLLPHHRFQPFFTGLTGFAVSPRDIPVFNSSSFNYTFEFGAGVEIYQSHTRSCQLEYRYHHLASAAFNSNVNPGVDSGVMKVTYSFGR